MKSISEFIAGHAAANESKKKQKQLGAYIERYDYFENKHTGVTSFIFDVHCSEKEFNELMKHFDEDKEIITVFTK